MVWEMLTPMMRCDAAEGSSSLKTFLPFLEVSTGEIEPYTSAVIWFVLRLFTVNNNGANLQGGGGRHKHDKLRFMHVFTRYCCGILRQSNS